MYLLYILNATIQADAIIKVLHIWEHFDFYFWKFYLAKFTSPTGGSHCIFFNSIVGTSADSLRNLSNNVKIGIFNDTKYLLKALDVSSQFVSEIFYFYFNCNILHK